MLEVKNLKKSFSGFVATNDVSFTVDKQQIYAIIGPNGAGKSTLFNLITGHLAPDTGTVVLEGRDIGTVVFPDAEVKFFLTASAEVRSRRRHAELVAKGQTVTFEETLADVKQRDAQDEGRAVAPLKKAEGAVLVDSTDLDFEATVAQMLAHVKRVAEA